MRIRTFTLDDLPAARGLWESAEGMHPPPDEEVERKLERDPELFLVAETTSDASDADRADRMVGVVMGTYDGRRGWIFRLAVDPEHRRTGVGRALVDELERRFAARGIRHLRLLAFADNAAARGFWEELGYVGTPDVVMYSKDLPEA